jgi:hypothetical protein
MKARYVEVVGTRASLRAYWDLHAFDPGRRIFVGQRDCPNSYGTGKPGVHDASVHLEDSVTGARDHGLGGHVEDYGPSRWPSACAHCGVDVPDVSPAHGFGDMQKEGWVLEHQVHRQTLYGTPDGSWYGLPQVGDMLYEDWYGCVDERQGRCIYGWTNCAGPHLIIVMPTERWWDPAGRASNCTRKNDTTHRCWVRHGDPAKGEVVHVDKAGVTCRAGAGSLAIPGWHGFLHNGDIHEGCTSACRR